VQRPDDPRIARVPMIDPQVQKILYSGAARPGPGYIQLGAQAAREWRPGGADAGCRPVPCTTSTITGSRSGRTITVRQYVPFEHGWAQPQPALLFCHGGGFTIGSVDTHDRLCRVLAGAGRCHVYSVDYRLAPEHRFPQPSTMLSPRSTGCVRRRARWVSTSDGLQWVATAPEARWLRPARCMRATATSRWSCNC
jgi:acetyl esterase